jgi:hypothetical protein
MMKMIKEKKRIIKKLILPFLFLFCTFLSQKSKSSIGWIAGKVLNIIDDSPISGAKIEILRQKVEKLPDSSFSVKKLEEAIPLGIVVTTD